MIAVRRFFPQLTLSDEINDHISAGVLKLINQQNIEYYERSPLGKGIKVNNFQSKNIKKS